MARAPVTGSVARGVVAAVFAASAVVLAAGSAPAQTGLSTTANPDAADYEAQSERWNGLNTFTAVAKGLGLRIYSTSNIEWEDVDSADILLVLYPRERVEPGHIAGFVQSGGRLLLADDYGDSTEALARLGMLREPALGVGARRFYRDLPYVPMAQPLNPGHPLAAGVTELATNHPSVLSRVQGPQLVFGFGPTEGVIAAGALGRGRFIVSSDPSIFINRMLQFDGNLQFAVNALRFLITEGQTQRLVILSGDFDLYGEPTGMLDDGTVSGTVSNMLSEFNRWLDERNDYLLTLPGMSGVSIILAIIIAFLALLSLPVIRKALFDGSWTRAVSLGPSLAGGDYEVIVEDHESASARKNFLIPATVIRDTVNTRLSRIVGEPDVLYSRKETSLVTALAAERGPAAAHALQHIYARLKPLPSRTQAASPWSSGHMSRRDFERLEADAAEFFRLLDASAQATG